MKIGIRLHDTISGTLDERLAFTRKQGFQCAHLALSKVLPDFAMKDAPAKLAEEGFDRTVREPFRRNGMDIAVLGCYLSLTQTSEEERLKTREIYMAHLAFARKVGAWMVGTETPALPESAFAKDAPGSEEAYRFLIQELRPIVRRAEEENVILAVEPVLRHIISTPERAERMLEDIHSDHLRIILDAVNLLGPENIGRREQVLEEAMRRLGDRVALLHMKDYRMEGNTWVPDTACGTGDMEYGALMAFARERDISMTLENTCPENAEEAKAALLRS